MNFARNRLIGFKVQPFKFVAMIIRKLNYSSKTKWQTFNLFSVLQPEPFSHYTFFADVFNSNAYVIIWNLLCDTNNCNGWCLFLYQIIHSGNLRWCNICLVHCFKYHFTHNSQKFVIIEKMRVHFFAEPLNNRNNYTI